MALVTTTEMFKKAYDGGYAIGAFNVNNMEIVQGITEAARDLEAPLILQVSKGARAYANHTYLVKLVEAAVIECPNIPIALHLDHGPDFETCKSCIDGGFTSVMIDASSNEVYSATLNLPSMESTQIIKSLKTAFPGYPVDLLNDTACYSYAEKVYGNIKEKNFAFLNFGRGIGATLFTEGSMLGTASGSSTQFGHYSIDPHGPECICGNHGCLEVMISEQALKNRIPEFGQIPSLSALSEITFSDLGKAATFRDPTALAMVKEMAWELSIALSNLISTVNPSLIVLGGKIPDLGEYFLNEVREDLKKTGFRRMVDNVTVRYSQLQSDSFLNGAMKYFFDIHYSFTNQDPTNFFIG